ncbi:hypothetical protein K0U83_00430 [bacterium]|jgi:hypothetical protein|nr:hypothetical protein [bacterium]
MAGPNGLNDATWDTASSLSVRFGGLKAAITKLTPSKVEIKVEKIRRVGEMLQSKRTPGVAEISDCTGEMLTADYVAFILPRMPEQGGTLTELATLVQFSHASVVGQYSILLDRCRFTVIEGPEIDASEKGAITKFTMSCMARYDKGADGKWKALFSVPGRPSSTATALLKF